MDFTQSDANDAFQVKRRLFYCKMMLEEAVILTKKISLASV